MPYYSLDQDMSIADQWHIGDIREVAADCFFDPLDRSPVPLDLTARVAHHGRETDFAVGWRFLFVSERARQVIAGTGVSEEEIVFHPVRFDNHAPSQAYHALSIRKVRACVDEARSEWSPCYYGEGETPTSRGFLRLYGAFFELAIDEERVAGLDVLRVEGAKDLVVVSDRIMDAFVAAGLTGARFTRVS